MAALKLFILGEVTGF